MRRYFRIFFFMLLSQASMGQSKHVILISIDGFHPDMYLDKSWPTPNLQYLMKNGTYADKNISVFPAYTHPAHAAMETGAFPARSGITYNQPKNDDSGDWNWYYRQIKAPTIWEAVTKNHMTTAAIMWPNVVDGPITYNLGEIWDNAHPDDRATPVRKHAIPKGIYEEIEKNATGKLDSTNMGESYSLDENTGRMAAYIFKTYKPNFMAVHFATVDGFQHEFGREKDVDSVRLAVESNDVAVGTILDAIDQAKLNDSTTIIITGDHGFVTIKQVMRPNMLIKGLPVKFTAAGGSCFLYGDRNALPAVLDSLAKLPIATKKLFRIIDKLELHEMGADSDALLALAADPKTGTVFSGSMGSGQVKNSGPGTMIQNSKYEGLIVPTTGGHHGYDPKEPEMWTGFIAWGAGIKKHGHITQMRVVDIAPLIAKLLGITFNTPDGHLTDGILIN